MYCYMGSHIGAGIGGKIRLGEGSGPVQDREGTKTRDSHGSVLDETNFDALDQRTLQRFFFRLIHSVSRLESSPEDSGWNCVWKFERRYQRQRAPV